MGLADAGFADPVQRELYEKEGTKQLREFVRLQQAAPPADVIGTERSFEITLGGVRVKGRLDRIDRIAGNRVAIIDYKTGKPRTEDHARKSLQLSIYALAAREKWDYEAERLVFYNLADNTEVACKRDPRQLAEACQRVAEVAAEIKCRELRSHARLPLRMVRLSQPLSCDRGEALSDPGAGRGGELMLAVALTFVAVVLALIAVVAVVLVLRRPAPSDPQALEALRNDFHVLRESTDRSVSHVVDVFSNQLAGMGDNVQKALGAVNSNVAERLEAMNRQLGERLNENVKAMSGTSKEVNDRMAHVQNIFAELQKQVGGMSEQARHLAELSKSIADLQHILTAPKLRGGFGEEQLENLLAMVFAREQYRTQYAFSSGEKVDAVLLFPQGMVAIDSKFSLESFRRIAAAGTDDEKKVARREFLKDVRKRVDEIPASTSSPPKARCPSRSCTSRRKTSTTKPSSAMKTTTGSTNTARRSASCRSRPTRSMLTCTPSWSDSRACT